ncbi:MAG: DUF2312 domain-containing protein [Hyphomicrobium sp.]|jgi:uncharacterized protein (UPF0335 family)
MANTSDGEDRPNDVNKIVASQLTDFIARIERLEEEKKTIAEDIKDVKSECKAKGYDMKVVAEILKLRKMGADERSDWEAMRHTYGSAIGIFA